MVTDVKYTAVSGFEVVSLANAKKHLRIEATFTDEDTLIQSYIDAAVVNAENYIGGHIAQKDMVIKMDAFAKEFSFEAFPVISVTSVKYYPKDSETEETMNTADYYLTSVNPKVNKLTFKITPDTANRYDAVTVTIKVGYEASKIEKPILQAIKLQIADMYERREDRTEVTLTAAMALLRPYKKF